MSDSDISRLLAALECGRPTCRCHRGADPNGWYTRHCPAHHDVTPSLRLKLDGVWIAITCFAGWDRPAIIARLRLQSLWPARQPARVTDYAIKTPDGTVVAVHQRYEEPDGSKRCVWLRPDGQAGRTV